MKVELIIVAILLCSCSAPSVGLSDDEIERWLKFRGRHGCQGMSVAVDNPPTPTEESWARAEGFADFRELLRINARVELGLSPLPAEKDVPLWAHTLSLIPIDAETAMADAAAVGRHRSSIERVCPPPEPLPEWPARSIPSASQSTGRLSIATTPRFSQMTLNGRPYGSTPFVGPRQLTLPLGEHHVELVEAGQTRTRWVVTLHEDDPSNEVIIDQRISAPPRVKGSVSARRLQR